MDWIYLFASFSGRISRFPFWVCIGILVVVEFASAWLAYRIEGETLENMINLEMAGGDRLSNILDLVFIYPAFALAVKRSNDRNLSPWVIGMFFAINVAMNLFVIINGAIDPENLANQIIFLPFAVLFIVLIVELGFRRGTEGPNRFGPDPLANTPRS